jgi:hypothetical protein
MTKDRITAAPQFSSLWFTGSRKISLSLVFFEHLFFVRLALYAKAEVWHGN